MELVLELDKMTTVEKLRAMEEICADLSKNSNDVPVPEWHTDVLAARQQRVDAGASVFTDWKDVRQSIRSSC